jgi:hypothetical protein
MNAAPRLVLFSAAAAALASLAMASSLSRANSAPPPQRSPTLTAASLIDAIKDQQASIVRAKPACGEGGDLKGAFVMETPPRAGFPFDATTIAGPQGIFTNLTTSGNEGVEVIEAVAQTLNKRASDYVRQLLQVCSL